MFLPVTTRRDLPLSPPLPLFFLQMSLLLSLAHPTTPTSPPPPEEHKGKLPHFTLHNNRTIPLVGLGCASGVRKPHVTSALDAGYRLFDTAQSYNWGYREDEVGDALRDFHASSSSSAPPPPFVQTKIHPEDLGYSATKRAVLVSLQRLGVSRLDAVLLHKPRCWEGACRKTPEGTWQESWVALEELFDEGIVSAIGLCDVDEGLLEELLRQRVMPHVIQNWMDPFHQDVRMRERCRREGILFQGYSSLGSQWFHHRGYDENPVMTDPTLLSIARKYGATVPQVIINWATRRGVSVLPASTNPERQRSNLDSFYFDLTHEEIAQIDGLDDMAPRPRERDPREVSLVFENRGDELIDSYWVSDSKDEVHVGSIQAGDEISMTSYHGHRFVFRKEDGSMVGQHVVTKTGGRKQRHVVHAEL